MGMSEDRVIALFKCLSDRSRLRIVRTLERGDAYGELLAERLGITPATVSFHLKKLEEAGAVTSRREQYYTMYSLDRTVLKPTLLELICGGDEPALSEEERREEEYRQKVLRTFFEYGRLKAFPAQRKKYVICIEEIAKAFEIGKQYPERELNEIIERYHEDYCGIRREMLAEGILSREGTVYTRLK